MESQEESNGDSSGDEERRRELMRLFRDSTESDDDGSDSSGAEPEEEDEPEDQDENDDDDDQDEEGTDDGSEVEAAETPADGIVVGGDQGQAEEEEKERECLVDDQFLLSNCPICFERWNSDGAHRVCCIPCGHVYGRSCLEKWLERCRKKVGECPQCKKKFKETEIINLYTPPGLLQKDAATHRRHRNISYYNLQYNIHKRFDSLELRLSQLHEKLSQLQFEQAYYFKAFFNHQGIPFSDPPPRPPSE